MLTKQELLSHLKALGDDPESVADSLASIGIKGARGDETTCPLANYVRSREGLGHEIHVSDCTCWIIREGSNDLYVNLPDACSDFIQDFDSGSYDDLYGLWSPPNA